MSRQSLLRDQMEDGIVRIRFDRPERRNAVDLATVDDLVAALDHDPAAVVLLGSASPDIFCAGVDLGVADGERALTSDRLYACYEVILTRPAPVIAVVEGPAVGGGAQLVTAADLTVAGPGALLRWRGLGHGLSVGAWVLPGLVGRARALDLLFTERTLTADEAKAAGLFTDVVPDPWRRALDLARHLRGLDSGAVARTRAMVADASLLARLGQERAGNRQAWNGVGPARP